MIKHVVFANIHEMNNWISEQPFLVKVIGIQFELRGVDEIHHLYYKSE